MAVPLRSTGLPVLLALTIGVVQAQTVVQPALAAASSPAMASSAARSPNYRSAFEGYRSFADQPLTPWREANDVVKSVGGWQAYAREGQGEPPAGANNAAAMPAAHAGMDMRPSASSGTPAPTSPAASSPGPSPAPVKVPPASVPRPAANAPSGTRPTGPTKPKKP
jgi:hypothetical protein